MIFFHPSIVILVSVLVLLACYKRTKLFNLCAIITPLTSLIIIYYMPDRVDFCIAHFTLYFEGSFNNKLIGYALVISLLTSNLYALGQKTKLDLIFGNLYAAFALACLFAGDFLSMFVNLELMMIVSAIIIFIGNNNASLRAAKKYFLTHLMSSNMIIIGIVHIIVNSQSIDIVNVVTLINNPHYSSVILYIMLAGMVINVAAFPFSGWMVNYYSQASASGFLYLISFTTKVSIMLLLKMFAGLEVLKYVALIMISYAIIKLIFEDNLLKLLCYLSICAMGLMILGISSGKETSCNAVVCYLFIHILYKSLLSLCCATIIDKLDITTCSNLTKINNKILFFGFIVSVMIMLSLPGMLSFSAKSIILGLYSNDIIYIIPLILSAAMVYSIPWYQLFRSQSVQKISLNIYTKAGLLISSCLAIGLSIYGNELLMTNNTNLFGYHSLKQLLLVVFPLIVALIPLFIVKRSVTKPINLIEWLGDVLFYYLTKFHSNNDAPSEPLSTGSLYRQINTKLTTLHNQQTAIFIIFVFLLSMFLIMAFCHQ